MIQKNKRKIIKRMFLLSLCGVLEFQGKKNGIG